MASIVMDFVEVTQKYYVKLITNYKVWANNIRMSNFIVILKLTILMKQISVLVFINISWKSDQN